MDLDDLLLGKEGEVLVGEPIMTKFEKARIIGARALQLSQGAPTLIVVDGTFDFRPIDMARMELAARVLPLGIARKYPNHKYQIIPIQWLKDREFISQVDEIEEIK